MNQIFVFIILICLLLPSCNSAPPTVKPEQVTVQYTAASIPWLMELNSCAGGVVVRTEQVGAEYLDPQFANMFIRIGKPAATTSFVYQIGTEDLLVIVNHKNPISKLSADQVKGLFIGQINNWKAINGTDASTQVWVFPASEDIQDVFNQTILQGSPVTSAARMANSPDEMLQALGKNVNAIGIITRRLKAGNITDVFTAASSLPVLAISSSKPQGAVAHILACMQK